MEMQKDRIRRVIHDSMAVQMPNSGADALLQYFIDEQCALGRASRSRQNWRR